MKKPDNIEKEIDAIRKQLQKERKGMTVEEDVEKTNKMARELAKIYGFKFQSDLSDKTMQACEETTEYEVTKKSD